VVELPFIQYAEPDFGALETLNYGKGRHGVHYIQSVEGLTGTGVVVGVGDNGRFDHLDGRNRTINNISISTAHGNNICGLIAGGGIIDPRYAGYAPRSNIITERFDDVIDNTLLHHVNDGMVVTNNAYGAPSCSFNGWYSSSSRDLDMQSLIMPEVLHVFGAGNNGINNTNCGFKGCGFGSVLGGYQSSKNAITVGNLSTKDEVHRNQNNANPPNYLLKSILCNTADDIGNPGPDYTYGFGQLNLVNASKCLKNNQFYLDSLSNGQSLFRAIAVPPNVKLLKINLYWNDVQGPIYSPFSIVDNLDVEVLPPNGAPARLPLILDSNLPDKYAVPGKDSINNIEQVVINNPDPGLYIARINGTSISGNKTKFALSYSFVKDTLLLTKSQTIRLGSS